MSISQTTFLQFEFVIFYCSLVQAANRSCGTPKILPKLDQTIPKPGKYRIVSGYESTPHSFPWIVSIARSGEHFCGGTIIRCPNSEQAKVVVSAAHCFYGLSTNDVSIRLGAHNLKVPPNSSTMEHIVKLKDVVSHENFNLVTFANDIALVKLEKPVNFNDWIQPICLPKLDSAIKHGVHVAVAGWGAAYSGGPATPVLQQVDLKVIDTRLCNKSFPAYNGFLSNSAMICAGYRTGKYDACQGDSGGPLIMPVPDSADFSKFFFVLVGAVSFGEGCAEPDRPGIYTRISTYLDWLNTKMASMCAN